MSRAARFLSRGFRGLLRFYPASFRAEFGMEMNEVFVQAVTDTKDRGRGALAALILRELGTWPGALGREWSEFLQARLDLRKGATMEGRLSQLDPESSAADSGAPAPRGLWGES